MSKVSRNSILFFVMMLLAFDIAYSLLSTCQQIHANQPSYGGPQGHCSAFSGFVPWVIGVGLRPVHHFLKTYEHPLVAGFTIVLAGSTIALWWSTRRLWEATKSTLDHAKETAETQLRAYVNVTKVSYNWNRPSVRIVFSVLNSGQTPATYFEVGCIGQVREAGKTGPFDIPTNLKYSLWTSLGAGKDQTVGSYVENFAEQIREVMESDGKKNFFVIGRVRYGDAFGNEYESEFAYFSREAAVNKIVEMSRSTGRMKTYHKTKQA